MKNLFLFCFAIILFSIVSCQKDCIGGSCQFRNSGTEPLTVYYSQPTVAKVLQPGDFVKFDLPQFQTLVSYRWLSNDGLQDTILQVMDCETLHIEVK